MPLPLSSLVKLQRKVLANMIVRLSESTGRLIAENAALKEQLKAKS